MLYAIDSEAWALICRRAGNALSGAKPKGSGADKSVQKMMKNFDSC